MTDQRRSTRAQLNLPVRIRWQGPLGQQIELAETLDVSRSGLLFYRTAPLPVRSQLWVIYPYSPEEEVNPPETPARVVRVKTTPGGGQLVALEFQPLRRDPVPPAVQNRRRGQRTPVALPVRLRLAGIPWPEEAMTLDVSDGGVLFRTARLYVVGAQVRVSLASGRWAVAHREMPARVVRVQPVPDSVESMVALALEK